MPAGRQAGRLAEQIRPMAAGGEWCDTRNGSRSTDLEGGVGVEQFWYCKSISPVGSSGNLTWYAAPSLLWETPAVLCASRHESNGQ